MTERPQPKRLDVPELLLSKRPLQQAAKRWLKRLADQKRVMAYLLSNSELWSQREQEEHLLLWLEEAKNPKDALSRMLEWFAMLKLANDTEFTLAASEPPTA